MVRPFGLAIFFVENERDSNGDKSLCSPALCEIDRAKRIPLPPRKRRPSGRFLLGCDRCSAASLLYTDDMQTTGEQNYWQSPDETDTPAVSNPSQYVGDGLGPQSPQPQESDTSMQAPISWEASEYIHHEKNTGWFVALLAIAAILAAFALFIMKSYTFALLVCVMAVAIVIFARRPPRILHYSLTAQGLDIDGRHYSYHDFRAFAVVQDGPLYSIMLITVKRFGPTVTVYFPEEHGEAIVDSFGAILPMEQRDLDFMDQLARRLRF